MIRYEIKKIFSKSISKVSLVVLLFSLLISCYFAITNVSFLDKQGKSHTGIEAAKSAARLPTVRAPIAAAGSVVCGYVYSAPAAIGVFRGVAPKRTFLLTLFLRGKE